MMRATLVFVSAGLCASAFAADIAPELAPRGTMASRHVAHIYYNLATGERVATLLDTGVRPADNGVSPTVWVSDNYTPCSGFGQSGGTSGLMDSPDCTTCLPSTATGVVYLDWADIGMDTVVDCVGITWASDVQDTDTDSDGIGDGVEGFAGTWMWFDADDGFLDASGDRRSLVGLTLLNLPGFTGTWEPNLLPIYTATVDLTGSTSSSGMVFEIGDTDSFSSAPIFNPGIGNTSDLDSDGLADFSYALMYTQPGTFDFDNADGDSDTSTGVDGDPANQGLTGWPLAAGYGDVSTDGSTYTPETSKPGDVGAQDAFDFYVDIFPGGSLDPIGTFWYGGFHCDIDGNGAWERGANENPWTQFRMILYGPGEDLPCPADLDGNGLLNFFDVNAFVTDFMNRITTADLAPPYGTFDIFDIFEFIRLFNEGCP